MQDQETELSIIIPAYNVERYIERCVKSIVQQQGADKYEIIIVNDGSTDKTSKILNFLPRKYGKNIRVIPLKKNTGVSVARNIGIKESSGKFLTFVDPDDMVGLKAKEFDKYFSNEPFKIGELDTFANLGLQTVSTPKQTDYDDKYFVNMLQVADRTNADVVLGGHIAIHYDTRCMTRRTYAKETVRGPDAKDILLVEVAERQNANFALYSREMLDAHNLRFMVNMDLDEDILFCMLAVLYAPKVATAPDVTYFYNRHRGTLSNISDESVWAKKYQIAQIKKFSVLLNEIAKMPHYMIPKIFGYWAPFYIRWADIRRAECSSLHCQQKNCTDCPVATRVLAHCEKNIEKYITR